LSTSTNPQPIGNSQPTEKVQRAIRRQKLTLGRLTDLELSGAPGLLPGEAGCHR